MYPSKLKPIVHALCRRFWRSWFVGVIVLFSLTAEAGVVYDVVDIGTNAPNSNFGVLNNRGEAAGQRTILGSPQTARFLVFLPQPAYGMPAGVTEFEIPGAYSISVTDINENGTIIGSWTAEAFGSSRGFTWHQGDFISLDNGVYTRINDHGWKLGGVVVLATNNTYIIGDLPFGPPGSTPGRTVSVNGVALNNSGKVLLDTREEVGTSPGPFTSNFKVFAWQNGVTEVIPGLGDQPGPGAGTQTFASDMNNHGQSVGKDLSGVWLHLPSPAYGLNAGVHFIDPQFAHAQKINDYGVVILSNNDSRYWETGKVTDIQTKLPPDSPWIITGLHDVNNLGQFVGRGSGPAPNRSLFLTPRTVPTIVVNNASDAPDADPFDGVIDTDLSIEGLQVTLRAAIDHANSTNRPGSDTIEFDIQGAPPLISPTNALPTITDPIVLDGHSQAGVELSGLSAGDVDGLKLIASNCVIRGLSINRFQRAGVAIEGGHSHRLTANNLGTDSQGSPNKGNGTGVRMLNSLSNILGGLTTSDRNVISGNLADGVAITNSSDIELRANLVGTTPDGAGNLPNLNAGLLVNQATRLTVGVSGAPSVFNSTAGMILRKLKTAVLVNCNIGLNGSGAAGLGGTTDGVQIENSEDVTVGQTSSRNYFGSIVSKAVAVFDSTNVNLTANYIGTDRAGANSQPVGIGVLAERARGLAIGSTTLSIISATNGAILRNVSGLGTNNSQVTFCNFGLSQTGVRIGNMVNGLISEGSEGLTIGGSNRNVFGGILSNAVAILQSTNVQLTGNYIGTDRGGNNSVPVSTGVFAENSRGIFLGVSNILSVVCATNGALIRNVSGISSNLNTIVNTHFGLGANGTSKVGNMVNGIAVESSSDFVLGGAAKIIMGGILSNGISLKGLTNVQIPSVFIGTDRTGNASQPVGTGFLMDGIRGLAIGASNSLSVICATNGAIIRNLSAVGTNLNTIFNCHFGIGSNGTSRVGNMVTGLAAEQSSGLSVGGIGGIARNVFAAISNNISLKAITNIHLPGNFIGTDRTGNALMPARNGIIAELAENLVIGSSNALTVITTTNGILMRQVSGLSNLLNNVYLGIAAHGTNKLGNMATGVIAENSSNLRLGDSGRNIFGGISSNAIFFNAVTNVQLLANWIGTDATGTNRQSIGLNGIIANATRLLTVGDETGDRRPLIGGCGRNGIQSTDSVELCIVNSSFGAISNGFRNLSNTLSSVSVHLSSLVAATAPPNTTVISGNTIANSGGSGVEFSHGAGGIASDAIHVIQRNLIYSNSGSGIRLGTNVGSVTIGGALADAANNILRNAGSGISKVGVGDRVFVEINNLASNAVKAIERSFDPQSQGAPQITSAIKGSTRVQGSINGQPNQAVKLHFYAHRPKAGAQGEGEMWVGTVNVPLDGSGNGNYNTVFPRTSPGGWLVASTAADPVRGTSEFSNSQIVQNPTDSDGDGLPDFWEALYPSCLNAAVADPPTEDCDGDGFTNLQEYIAQTDPTQANSALRVDGLLADGEGASINFNGVAGRQYGLDRKTDLSGPWERIATTIPNVDGPVTLSDPAPPAGFACYRLVAEFP